MTPLTPAERDALRLRAAKADEVFSGRTVGELILDVRRTRADASAGLLGAALDAILAQCLAEPFEPWPGSLVAELVALGWTVTAMCRQFRLFSFYLAGTVDDLGGNAAAAGEALV